MERNQGPSTGKGIREQGQGRNQRGISEQIQKEESWREIMEQV